MNIIWLSSYPKSGNTWLRFFLYNYFFGEPKTSNEISLRIPDIHEQLPATTNIPGKILYKTHYLYSSKHPLISKTAGTIYLIRHPKDVLLSNLNYFKLINKNNSGNAQYSDEEIIMDFIKNTGFTRWKDFGMGSWMEHVKSWRQCINAPRLELRYEDLRNDPYQGFHKVIKFLDGEVDRTKLHDSINQSSLKRMKELEEKEIRENTRSIVFSGDKKSKNMGHRFINKGDVNQCLAHISKQLDKEFDEQFNDIIAEFGY